MDSAHPNPKVFPRKDQRKDRPPRHPLDRVAQGLMVILAIAAATLILLGDHATLRVQKFSWQGAAVGAEDRAFLLTFNRPVDTQSVEANLTLSPPLPGRISWAGRRLAYTLDVPIPYGESFEITLSSARDRMAQEDEESRFEPFQANFRSRDRAFVYLGTQGEEEGRLVLVNLSQNADVTLLTPPNLTVLDFQPYPLGDRLLFSALDRTSSDSLNTSLNPTLYTVTTGLAPQPPEVALGEMPTPSLAPDTAGTVTEVLAGDTFQNLAFDLSSDGRTIVIQRVNTTNPADFGPWVLRQGQEATPLDTEPGGEFLIAPDNATLLMLQGQGTAIIPLDAEGTETREPLDFLPEYGRVFGLTRNGLSAAMVDFNQNNPDLRFTQSLVLVSSRGDEVELLNVPGSILDAQFDPSDRILYVLSSDVLPGEIYQEQPTITAINLESQTPQPLVTFPPQAQVTMSVAPDGLALLLSAVLTPEDGQGTTPQVPQTWLLPVFSTAAQRQAATPTPLNPEPLPYQGLALTWLP